MSNIGTVVHLNRLDLNTNFSKLDINEIDLTHFKDKKVETQFIKTESGLTPFEITVGISRAESQQAHTIIFLESDGKAYRVLKDRYITKY